MLYTNNSKINKVVKGSDWGNQQVSVKFGIRNLDAAVADFFSVDDESNVYIKQYYNDNNNYPGFFSAVLISSESYTGCYKVNNIVSLIKQLPIPSDVNINLTICPEYEDAELVFQTDYDENGDIDQIETVPTCLYASNNKNGYGKICDKIEFEGTADNLVDKTTGLIGDYYIQVTPKYYNNGEKYILQDINGNLIKRETGYFNDVWDIMFYHRTDRDWAHYPGIKCILKIDKEPYIPLELTTIMSENGLASFNITGLNEHYNIVANNHLVFSKDQNIYLNIVNFEGLKTNEVELYCRYDTDEWGGQDEQGIVEFDSIEGFNLLKKEINSNDFFIKNTDFDFPSFIKQKIILKIVKNAYYYDSYSHETTEFPLYFVNTASNEKSKQIIISNDMSPYSLSFNLYNTGSTSYAGNVHFYGEVLNENDEGYDLYIGGYFKVIIPEDLIQVEVEYYADTGFISWGGRQSVLLE